MTGGHPAIPMPMTLNGSVGTRARRRTIQSSMSLLTGNVSLRAKLAARRPPSARPGCCDKTEPLGPPG